jgi:hypothetical protein
VKHCGYEVVINGVFMHPCRHFNVSEFDYDVVEREIGEDGGVGSAV